MFIAEFRRVNAPRVLADIEKEQNAKPQKRPHAKPRKAMSVPVDSNAIKRSGVSFALPDRGA